MLLILGSAICSCALLERKVQIETIFVPVLSKPVIPPEPVAPNLAEQLPESVVITAEEAQYYKDACDAWESNEYEESEILNEYGLSRSSACDWAIFGYTVQGELTVESIYNQQSSYVEQLRFYIQYLKSTIQNMYDASTNKMSVDR